MPKRQMTLVYYHIPEDGDTSQEPNMFAIPEQINKLTLEHIHQYFPLKGTYVFRFKVAFDNFIVWLDLAELSQSPPTFKNQIHLKANRLSWNQGQSSRPQSTGKGAQKGEDINLFDHHSEPKMSIKKQSGSQDLGGLDLLNSTGGKAPDEGLRMDFFGASEGKKENVSDLL